MSHPMPTGNADAKNLSFVHPAPGQIRLAPLHVQVPTALVPPAAPTCAMWIGGHHVDRCRLARAGPVDDHHGRRGPRPAPDADQPRPAASRPVVSLTCSGRPAPATVVSLRAPGDRRHRGGAPYVHRRARPPARAPRDVVGRRSRAHGPQHKVNPRRPGRRPMCDISARNSGVLQHSRAKRRAERNPEPSPRNKRRRRPNVQPRRRPACRGAPVAGPRTGPFSPSSLPTGDEGWRPQAPLTEGMS